MSNRSITEWLLDHPRVVFIGSFIASSLLLNVIDSNAEQSIIEERSLSRGCDNDLDLLDGHHMISDISHTTMGTQKCPHQVCSHIRNLSDGKRPSTDKRESAQEFGFVLSEHQTWIVSYKTGKK